MNAAATEIHQCRRCFRVLRSAASIARGYGKSCHTKVLAARATADLSTFKPEQIADAVELIEDGAIIQLRPGIFRTVSTDGSELHLTAVTGHCNCKAGLRGIRCYHVAAARIFALAA